MNFSPLLLRCLRTFHWGIICLAFTGLRTSFTQTLPPGFRVESFPLSPIESESQSASVIAQDSAGFIWFGHPGLKRYDGNELISYGYDETDSTSLTHNVIHDIYVSSDHQIWIGTQNGLNRYDPNTDGFESYHHDSTDTNSLSSNIVRAIVEDQKGQLWIGTNLGLNHFDPETGQFHRYLYIKDTVGQPIKIRVDGQNMLIDAAGTLWFESYQIGSAGFWEHGVLCRYDAQGDSIVPYWPEPNNPYHHSGNKISTLMEDSQGNFWVGGVNHELYLFDKGFGRFISKGILPPFSKTLKQATEIIVGNSVRHVFAGSRRLKMDSRIHFVFEDRDGKLWIEDEYPGIRYYDPETKSSLRIEIGQQSTLDIYSLFQTSDGLIWALMGNEVFKITPPQEMFQYSHIDTTVIGRDIGFNRIYVTTCYENAAGELWIGNNYGSGDENGLMWVSADRKQVRHYPPSQDGLQKGIIIHLFEDREGMIWIASMGPRNNPSSNKLYRFDPQAEHFEQIAEGKVPYGDMLEDSIGNLWVATWGQGLLKWDLKSKTFHSYELPGSESSRLLVNSINRMYADPDGTIWLAGGMGIRLRNHLRIQQAPFAFLAHFDPKTEVFQIYELPESDKHYKIHSIYRNSLGVLCGATNSGIFQFDEQEENFEFLQTAVELGNKGIASVAMDEDGYYWVAASNTITLLNPKGELVQRFTPEHNLKISQHFYVMFPGKSERSNFFLANYMEYGLFSPKNVRQILADKPSVVNISSFYLANEAVKPGPQSILQQPIWNTNQLKLTYEQNVFGFRFSTQDFQNPALNTYLYQLENYDDNWRDAGKEPQATYVKVPPGDYVFRAKTQNSFGQWSEEKSINIYISPPWWETVWAYSLYVLFGLGLLALLFYLQRKRQERQLKQEQDELKLRLQLQYEQEEAQRLKELDTAKARLYDNFTHEFRTPITIIRGESQEIKGNEERKKTILRNSNQLLTMVNRMLDLSKLEAGALEPEWIQDDIIAHLKYLVESFHSMAGYKDIRLSFYSPIEEFVMDFDPEKLQQIISNLLSNALKFTPQYGKVMVVANAEDSWLEIEVKDTGIGIAKEKLGKIFDRFYQVDDSSTRQAGGTGIGLALVRELIQLMKGEILVQSEQQRGTTFRVRLPIHHEAPLQQAPTEMADQPLIVQEIPQPLRQTQGTDLPKVLIIEDNPDMIAYVSNCLKIDYQVLTATNGKAGVETVFEYIPDLIICDVMMPELDGFGVVQQLKNDLRSSHIPIILLTAKAAQSDRITGLQYGADAYMLKPFDKEELLLQVHNQLQIRSKMRAYILADEAYINGNGPSALSLKDQQFVNDFRQIIIDNLDNEDMNIPGLCRLVGLSRSQLHKRITAITGASTSFFVMKVRMQEARKLLHATDQNVNEVAYSIGFKHPNHFSKAFKDFYGYSPSELKKS